MKPALLLFLFLISWSSAHAVTRELNQIYERSILIAGKEDQMDKRAMVLYQLYLDSNKEFTFGLSVSHLTLAIERSTHAPRFVNILDVLSMDATASGWKKWGQGLKKINQLMVQRLHFAYYASKLFLEKQTTSTEVSKLDLALEIRIFMQDTHSLFDLFKQVHRGQLTRNKKKELAAAFARWEHATIIQPRIEKLYEEMPSLIRYSVRNVPGEGLETILKTMQIRTTLGLKCLRPYTALRTKDFLDQEIRIQQAINFHELLERNNFDPNNKCFQDDYYTTRLPKRFHESPEVFSKWYYQFLIKEDFVNETEAWVHEQYQDIPLVEFASLPSQHIQMLTKDRLHLHMNRPAMERNQYINHRYLEISTELNSCMGFNKNDPFSNWYQYAYWASLSARKVISGEFFNSKDIAIKIGIEKAQFFGLFQKEKMEALFARTNNLIALEMIPLGEKFLALYCRNHNHDGFETFKNLLPNFDVKDEYLANAFENYYLAIKEEELKKKKEHIALASTLQVISEQIRIDDNIKEAFHYDGTISVFRYLFQWSATEQGALELSQSPPKAREHLPRHSRRINQGSYSRDINEIFNGETMHLIYDVRTKYTDPDLLDIQLHDYLRLHQEFGLETDITTIHKFKGTKVSNWSNLYERLKHLIAQFRTNMNNPKLFE